MGAKIVFADIQLDTGNIDPEAAEAAITPRTKAIVAVDYAGHPADLDELREVADKHGIYLIEDAAHAIGSTYKNRPVGSIADITTFSFFPTKNLTTAEGGAVASIHPDLLQKARRFSRQGLVREKNEFVIQTEGPWHQEVHEFGLNYRLPDVLCALGISQIKRIQFFKEKRAELFTRYREALGSIPKLELPKCSPNASPMWHLYPIRVPSESREKIFLKLRKNGFGVQVNYLPAHLHPVFRRSTKNYIELPNSENFYNSEISLPMWVSQTEWTEKYFTEIVNSIESGI
jgi:dTDP-4-amino-4,6-dideoxygalactose transaminase